MNKLSKELYDTSVTTSQSFSKVAKAAIKFSKMGLSIEGVLKKTNKALKKANE